MTPAATFKDVKVTKVENEAVRVTHSEGIALIDFDDLPPEMQLQYGWTPEKSAARKAAREAEAKRLADEERMIEEAPKRKAAEEEAKKRAEAERMASDAKEKEKAENAVTAKRMEVTPEEEKQLAVAAAQARAAIDGERIKTKSSAPDTDEKPGADEPQGRQNPQPQGTAVTPPFGTVSSLFEQQSIWEKHRTLWIGVGVGAVVVFLLFLLPSGTKKKAPRR